MRKFGRKDAGGSKEIEEMESELTYLFLFVVLIGLVLCPITH